MCTQTDAELYFWSIEILVVNMWLVVRIFYKETVVVVMNMRENCKEWYYIDTNMEYGLSKVICPSK